MKQEEDLARYIIVELIENEMKSSATRAYAQIYCSRHGLSYDELYNDEKQKSEGVAV